MSKKLQELMDDIRKWSDAAFGYGQRNPYIARHLLEEVKELIEELEAGTDHGQRQEFADCFMLLLDSASHANITASQLIEEAYNKLEINKQREWEEPDENGIIEHKRGGEGWKKIIVTKWTHPSTDSSLILAGTPNETLSEASQYFENDPGAMKGEQQVMDEDEFYKLPEFNG